jgi:hypothetical protein
VPLPALGVSRRSLFFLFVLVFVLIEVVVFVEVIEVFVFVEVVEVFIIIEVFVKLFVEFVFQIFIVKIVVLFVVVFLFVVGILVPPLIFAGFGGKWGGDNFPWEHRIPPRLFSFRLWGRRRDQCATEHQSVLYLGFQRTGASGVPGRGQALRVSH